MKLLKFNEMYKGELYNGIENIVLKDYQGNSFNIIGKDILLPKERLPIGKYPMTFTKDEVEMIIEDFNVIANLNNLRIIDYKRRYVDTEYTYYIGVFFDFDQYKKYYIAIEIETENYDEDLRSDIHSFITQQNNMGYSIDTESDENDNVWQILIFKKEENNSVMKHLESFKYILENESDEPDFNKVTIELTDLKGNKFELRSNRTLFDQDEVEMILEDFEVIPKLHNINLHSENHEYLYEDSDFYQFYRVCFAGSLDSLWGEEYILFELYLDELPNDVEEDLYSFINKIKNYGFNTIYNRKECNVDGPMSDKYSYIHITIEKI